MFIPRTSFRGAPRGAAAPARATGPRGRARRARLCALALPGAGALLLTALAPTALAEDPVAPAPAEAPEALFGDADPSYDGVWRQSYALLAQHTSGYTPAEEAVDWLVGQQCADGSFLAFRADPGEPCADVTASESNATALAVQALAAVGGHEDAVDAGVDWLTGVQNEDGGWGFSPGGASDANSTAVVVGALAAAGVDPNGVVREGSSGYSALEGLQLGCEAPEEQRGAFAWQPDEESGQLFASDMATVDAVLASYGSGLLVAPGTANTPVTPLDCADDEAEAAAGPAGAAQLVGALERGEGRLESTPPGGETQPDFGTTARAVLALSAGGHHEEAQAPLEWLRTHHAEWADHATNPTALGLLVLVARATDTSPTDFGGTNLLTLLAELGPDPAETPAGHKDAADNASDDDGMGPLPWIIGAGLLAGILIGTLLSFRRKAAAADDATACEGDGPRPANAEDDDAADVTDGDKPTEAATTGNGPADDAKATAANTEDGDGDNTRPANAAVDGDELATATDGGNGSTRPAGADDLTDTEDGEESATAAGNGGPANAEDDDARSVTTENGDEPTATAATASGAAEATDGDKPTEAATAAAEGARLANAEDNDEPTTTTGDGPADAGEADAAEGAVDGDDEPPATAGKANGEADAGDSPGGSGGRSQPDPGNGGESQPDPGNGR
ncbi:prenyltransferase/squalene oxidase repeat-containing protein [Streptomyces profundus]|uniref:prenyltransferase/squalene oxidase repeat-containing protein n=1 Tax=Streptomyces profundus TaxID=2867410 RepID=UPI001D165A65|nr:prenyltransferase/squalene oxidase repeat-containing protein [Streptomyces sp. MA3_2.13]